MYSARIRAVFTYLIFHTTIRARACFTVIFSSRSPARWQRSNDFFRVYLARSANASDIAKNRGKTSASSRAVGYELSCVAGKTAIRNEIYLVRRMFHEILSFWWGQIKLLVLKIITISADISFEPVDFLRVLTTITINTMLRYYCNVRVWVRKKNLVPLSFRFKNLLLFNKRFAIDETSCSSVYYK